MFVKLFVVATLLCILQCSVDVESFEFIRNTIKNVREKVHRIIHPNHIHDHNCKHTHENEEEYITTTIKIPAIDIRGGAPNQAEFTGSSSTSVPSASTLYPEDPNAVPDLNSRSIIGVPCPGGTRSVSGNCRGIVG